MSLMTNNHNAFAMTNGSPNPTRERTEAFAARKLRAADASAETNLFGELVILVKEHDGLVAELAMLRVKLNRAAAYQELEGSHIALGKAHFDRLKRKHSTILTYLRANRLHSRRFLQKLDSDSKLI